MDKELEHYQEVEDAWKQTLEHFHIDRPILSFEKIKIARLIKLYGWKATMYALVGYRFEPKTQNFDPSKHVGLSRVEQPHLFERFVNLAAQKKGAK